MNSSSLIGIVIAFVIGGVVGAVAATSMPAAKPEPNRSRPTPPNQPDDTERTATNATDDATRTHLERKVAELQQQNERLTQQLGDSHRALAAARAAVERAEADRPEPAPDGATGTGNTGGNASEAEPAAMTATEAMDTLKEALAEGTDIRGNERLMAALKAHGEELSGPLREWFARADNAVERAGVLRALAALGRTENLDVFREVLTTEGEATPIRRTAMSGLISAPDESSLPLLRDLVRGDSDILVQSLAGTAIGAIEGAGASEDLQAAYEETPNPMVRAFILRSMVERAEPERAPFFEAIARNTDERQDSRTAAVNALEKSLGSDALPVLEELARTVEDDFVRDAAERAAERLRNGE